MIFNTFDSDSDKVISKIGILGQSFEQLGASIKQRKTDIEELMDTMSKQDAEKQVGGVWGYLFGSKAVNDKPYNLDAFNILDKNSSNELLSTLKEWDICVKNNERSWDKYYATLKEGKEWQTKFIQNNDLQKSSVEDLIKASQDARTAAIAHNAAIEQQTLSAKAGQVALKGLAIAGNMIAAWAITKVISIVATKIDDLDHASEKCAERANELMKAYKSALDTANNNANTIDELASKYETLSKGVNNLGQNVSLTTDEYDEYNDIVNKIADIFPTLISGYTDEGTAILSLKGNVEELRNAYREAQQEAYNMLVITGKNGDGDDIIAQYKNLTEFSGLEHAIGGSDFGSVAKREVAQLIQNSNGDIAVLLSDLNNIMKEKSYGSQYIEDFIRNEIGLGIGGYTRFSGFSDSYKGEKLTSDDINNIREKAKAVAQTYNVEIKSALNDMRTIANAFLLTNDDYSSLDEQSKTVASKIINTINEEIANGIQDKVDIGKYVQSILDTIKNNPSVSNALLGLFTTDFSEMSPDDAKTIVDQYISKISEVLKEDELELKVRLGFGSTDELATKYQNALDNAKTKFGTDETNFFKTNSINTQEEIDDWIEIANASNSAASAEKKYLKHRKQLNKDGGEGLSSAIDEQKKSFDSAQSSIKTLDDALEKIDSKELDPVSLVNLANEFPELLQYVNSGTDDMLALQNAIDQIKSDKINRLKSELGEAATTADEEAKPAIYALIHLIDDAFPDRPTGILNGLEDTVSDAIELQEAFNIVSQAVTSKLPLQDEIITHLISLYPSLEDAIYRTVDGWYLEESAIDILSGKMGDFESSYFDAQKRMTELLNSGVGTRLKMLDIELSGVTNIATAYEAISNLNQIPRNAVDAEGNPEVDLSDFNSLKEAILLQGQMAELLAQFDNLNKSGLSSTKSNQKSEEKEKAPNTQVYDLADRRKSKLEKEHDIIEEMTNDENIAYENQLSLLSDLIELDNKRKQFADKTAANYAKDWSDAQGNILQAINGSNYNFDDIINYIKEGHDRNLEFVGDDIVASIDAAIVAWDTMNEYEEYSANLQKEINEHLEKQRQIRLDIANAQADEISAKANKLQSQIDLIEAKGGIASEDMLRRQIRISKDLEDSHRNQINALEDMLDNADPLSAEYYNIKSQIEGCKNDIIQCQIEQANWNEELLNLPIRRVERYLELLANIKQDLTNFIDVQTASGQATTLDQYHELIGLTNEQMDSLMQKHDELQNKLSNYKYGSDKFNEVQSDIQSVEDEIASLIKSTKEWISEILNIPINSIQKVNSELSNIVKNMGDILSDYDTAINAVTGTIDKQIESINDLSDAANKEYQDKIDPLQNELDLLQKQNDARKTELALEQAQYDLERAKNQKTNKVVRNGEIVYEADQEALRNANAANADAEYNETIDTLEGQIEALENQRDEILEGYDQQLEKLDEIKERWSKIASDVQLATDSLKADELLGKGWQDKVLSGNDSDIFKAMKDWYSSLATQQNQYEQQIESNERIAALMEQFAALYQDGSITYEQAMAGIQNLTAQLGNGFTALENLNALLQIGGADSLSSLLDKAQNNATQSVSQMADYLKAVKQNSDALADYVMTWDEMKQNIKDQVEALKAAAEALKNRPVSKPSSSHDNDDDRGYRGPTDTYVNGEYVHTNDGWGNYYDKNTGEKVDDPAKNLDTILDKHKKHDGIESGLIGRSDMTRERMLKSLATNSLKPNETLSKVLVGEAVLTKKQQEQLLKNFQLTSSISTPVISLPEVASVNDAQSNVEVNMGNIVLQGVQDPDGLARAIKQNLSGIMRQELHKR